MTYTIDENNKIIELVDLAGTTVREMAQLFIKLEGTYPDIMDFKLTIKNNNTTTHEWPNLDFPGLNPDGKFQRP